MNTLRFRFARHNLHSTKTSQMNGRNMCAPSCYLCFSWYFCLFISHLIYIFCLNWGSDQAFCNITNKQKNSKINLFVCILCGQIKWQCVCVQMVEKLALNFILCERCHTWISTKERIFDISPIKTWWIVPIFVHRLPAISRIGCVIGI